MNNEELIALRLYRQHITNPADKLTVIYNLNGLQAQFLSYAFHAARIRTQEPLLQRAFFKPLPQYNGKINPYPEGSAAKPTITGFAAPFCIYGHFALFQTDTFCEKFLSSCNQTRFFTGYRVKGGALWRIIKS